MSKLKFGTEEYNRAANRIADLNLLINNFLNKFDAFRKDYNITDRNLNEKLQCIVDEIDSFIDNEPEDIKSHGKTKINLNTLQENTISSVYVCNTCDEEIGHRYKDIQQHLMLNSHIKKMAKYALVNNDGNKNMGNLNEQNKGAPETLQQSRENKRALKKEIRRRERAKKENKETGNLPKKAKSFIFGDFSNFLIQSSNTGNKLKWLPAYKEIEKSLIESVSSIYPDAKIHFFGSRRSGLGTIHSDLDIFLNIGNVFNLYGEPPSQIVSKLNKVGDILSKNSNEWDKFVKVKTARVPVLKVFNKIQLIDCDIAFSNGLGPCNTRLIGYLFELQPLCHKMCLFMKEWLSLTTLKTHFTTYTTSLMVVFFLQTKAILPPIKILQEEIKDPVLIGPWQSDFIEKKLKELQIQKHDDSYIVVRTFLREFFHYYRDFDFKNLVISPYLGMPIKKEYFNTARNPMTRYLEFYNLNRDQNSFQINKPMCVQDPLEQNHNVAKAITDNLLKQLRHYFSLSYKELQ